MPFPKAASPITVLRVHLVASRPTADPTSSHAGADPVGGSCDPTPGPLNPRSTWTVTTAAWSSSTVNDDDLVLTGRRRQASIELAVYRRQPAAVARHRGRHLEEGAR